jgi:hypothetical protein
MVDALEGSEHPDHLFALEESMGAGIALQSAAVEPGIEAVVAESAFADLSEPGYDYTGLRRYPWLGKTLLAPFRLGLGFSWRSASRVSRGAGFAGEVRRRAGFPCAADLRGP